MPSTSHFAYHFCLLYFIKTSPSRASSHMPSAVVCSGCYNKIQTACNLWWFDLRSFDFMMVQKWYVFRRNWTFNFAFFSFPRLDIHSRVLSHEAGQGSELKLPASHMIVRVNNQFADSHSQYSLSVQYSVNYMRYSTLYYKISFVLDDFRCPIVGNVWRRNGNPLQYCCLENSMDRGAWWATVHGVTKSWTWQSD